MSSNAALSSLDRRDAPLDSALETITEGRLHAPNTLQFALFPRLMTQDTGLLIPTGPCAGRLEAVFIPYMINVQPRDFAHRLYIVSADGAPLDDYLFRLGPYLQALVKMDKIPRTFWLEEPERTPIARRYFPDGTFQNGAADHPFSQGVDVVAMPFSHFRALFFGTGGVYGVPEVIGFDKAMASEMKPRGLFYFDDAFGPTRDVQLEFVRMVEFLFAQDLDVIVGSSSMPGSLEDELSFLEVLKLEEVQSQPNRSLQFVETSSESTLDRMVGIANDSIGKDARVVLAFNDPSDERISEAHAVLSYGATIAPLLYRSSSSRTERVSVYAELKQRDTNGQGYTLIVDGPSLEVSDLDATVLITEVCHPLNLIRRAGRCNRCGPLDSGSIYVVGELEAATCQMQEFAGGLYKNLLTDSQEGILYDFNELASLVA